MNELIIAPLFFFVGVFFAVCFFDKRSREIISKLREDNKLFEIDKECIAARMRMLETQNDRYRNQTIRLECKIYELEEKQKCST